MRKIVWQALLAVLLVGILAGAVWTVNSRFWLPKLTPEEEVQVLVLNGVIGGILEYRSWWVQVENGEETYFFSASESPFSDVSPAVLKNLTGLLRRPRQFSDAVVPWLTPGRSDLYERATGKRGILVWVASFTLSGDGPLSIDGGYSAGRKNGAGMTFQVRKVNGRWRIVSSKRTWIS